MTPTLAQLDALPADEAAAALAGLYEHSPWIAEAAVRARPFGSLARLKQALVAAVDAGGRDAQLALLRAHPRLAGKAMVAGTLTAESTDEQRRSGLTHCSPEEFARLHALNDAYDRRFGWPFILAVRGPDRRGTHARGDHRGLRAPAAPRAGGRVRRMPAQRAPDRGDPARGPVRRRARGVTPARGSASAGPPRRGPTQLPGTCASTPLT